jgi:hypothetical protein
MPAGHPTSSSDPNLTPAPIPSDGAAALEETYKALEQKALGAMRWYEARQRSKKLGARLTRGGAIVLGAVTTIVPSLIAMLPQKVSFWGLHNFPAIKLNPLATILGVLSATAILLDRFYGYSSSWMRYVTTYQEIQSNLEEFRLGWQRHLLKLNRHQPPKEEHVLRVYDFFSAFLRSVNNSVRNETQTWLTEFKGLLSDADRVVEAQRTAAAAAARTSPGGLKLTVPDYETLDNRRWMLQVGDRDPETRVGQSSAAVGELEPGLYRLQVAGQRAGKAVGAELMVTVKAGEVTEQSMPKLG